MIVFSAMLKTLNYAPITKHRRMPSSDNACAQFWQASGRFLELNLVDWLILFAGVALAAIVASLL